MSRRLRTKYCNPKDKFGRNHHLAYSSSTTHFPTAYSIFGKPIGFPSTLLPFVQNTHLNFCGSIQQFNAACQQYESRDLQKEQSSKLSELQIANISIQGDIIQQYHPFATGLIFVCTMIFVLPFMLFKTSCFRQRFFTKYRFDSYNDLAHFIRKLKSARILILNFQDNFFDDSKAQILEKAILSTKIKEITLRNHSYRIKCNCKKTDQCFRNLRSSKSRQFKFIWEQCVLKNQNKKQQEQGLVSADLSSQQ